MTSSESRDFSVGADGRSRVIEAPPICLRGFFYIVEKPIKAELKIKMKPGGKMASTNWLKNHRREKGRGRSLCAMVQPATRGRLTCIICALWIKSSVFFFTVVLIRLQLLERPPRCFSSGHVCQRHDRYVSWSMCCVAEVRGQGERRPPITAR